VCVCSAKTVIKMATTTNFSHVMMRDTVHERIFHGGDKITIKLVNYATNLTKILY
jgi:hypothetical protein